MNVLETKLRNLFFVNLFTIRKYFMWPIYSILHQRQIIKELSKTIINTYSPQLFVLLFNSLVYW